MKQDSIEQDVKYIKDETLRLSTQQPFYDGQLKVNAFLANYSVFVTTQAGYPIAGAFYFNNQSKIIPFCRIVPVFYVNGVMQDSSTMNMLYSYRLKALYTQSNQVGYEYQYYPKVPNGTNLEIKPFIITNDLDTGYSVNGSWSVLK